MLPSPPPSTSAWQPPTRPSSSSKRQVGTPPASRSSRHREGRLHGPRPGPPGLQSQLSRQLPRRPDRHGPGLHHRAPRLTTDAGEQHPARHAPGQWHPYLGLTAMQGISNLDHHESCGSLPIGAEPTGTTSGSGERPPGEDPQLVFSPVMMPGAHHYRMSPETDRGNAEPGRPGNVFRIPFLRCRRRVTPCVLRHPR